MQTDFGSQDLGELAVKWIDRLSLGMIVIFSSTTINSNIAFLRPGV